MEELLERLHSALPWLTSTGGVVHPGTWGSRSLRGALFMGDQAYDAGAVGALLQGPLQVLHACHAPLDPVCLLFFYNLLSLYAAASISSSCNRVFCLRCISAEQLAAAMALVIATAALQWGVLETQHDSVRLKILHAIAAPEVGCAESSKLLRCTQMDAAVAHGCRPVGRPMRVTQVAKDGLILGLNDEPALTQVLCSEFRV